MTINLDMYQNRSADRNVEKQTDTLNCQSNVNPKEDASNEISKNQLVNVVDSDVFLLGETRQANADSNASIKVSSLSLEQ